MPKVIEPVIAFFFLSVELNRSNSGIAGSPVSLRFASSVPSLRSTDDEEESEPNT